MTVELQVEEERFLGRRTLAAEWRNWSYFIGYIGALLMVGFAIASPVLLYLWREAGVRFTRSLIATAIFAA